LHDAIVRETGERFARPLSCSHRNEVALVLPVDPAGASWNLVREYSLWLSGRLRYGLSPRQAVVKLANVPKEVVKIATPRSALAESSNQSLELSDLGFTCAALTLVPEEVHCDSFRRWPERHLGMNPFVLTNNARKGDP
jgi:hypothetical protein